MDYDVALICENGHEINSFFQEYPDNNSAYCSDCGAPTIHQCPDCGMPIKGHSTDAFTFTMPYKVPAFCEYCGIPFPWTKNAVESAALLIQEEEGLSNLLKDSLIESLPDVISETPKTPLAIIRTKKVLSSAGRFTSEGIRQFIMDFGCELIKKSLGL